MSAADDSHPLPLDALHRAASCTAWVQEGDCRVPEHYGDATSEAKSLVADAALYDGSAWGRVEALGSDARRLVNGFCTVEVENLDAGAVTWGLLTGAKGHVLADATFAVDDDRLWLRLPPGQGRLMRDHLSKYVIAEDVRLLPMSDLVPLWLFGPRAVDRLQAAGVEVPEPQRQACSTVWGTEVQLDNSNLLGIPGICISVSASIVKALAVELQKRLPVDWVGRRALESARIRSGAPRWGADFGSDTLPQEAGLNAAIDYEKGCYLGQEVVARLHYRGREQRRLCLVEVEGPVSVSAAVIDGGTQAGVITSLDPLAVEGEPAAAIAMLKRGAVESESRLKAQDSSSLTVIRYLSVDRFGMPDADATGAVGSSVHASSDGSQ